MDSRLGDRNDYTLTDLPICNECGTNTRSNGWVNRVPSDFDICGKRHAEGQEADRSDVLNIETYKCGTCIGDWAEEILDEDKNLRMDSDGNPLFNINIVSMRPVGNNNHEIIFTVKSFYF